MVCASRPAARLLRTAAPFELPGGYFDTTRLIIRLVVQRIIRLVVYYQLKADNPAGNPAVSFVVYKHADAPTAFWRKRRVLHREKGGQVMIASWGGKLVSLSLTLSGPGISATSTRTRVRGALPLAAHY